MRLLVSTRHEHLLIHAHACFSYSHHQHLSLLVITGTIPAFSTLTNLRNLFLDTNSLTGEHSTRTLVDTRACCYSYSHHQHLSLLVFTGTIPAFSTLTKLQLLALDSNSLTGEHSTRTLVDIRACLLFILTSLTPLSSRVHRHDSCI